MSNKKMKRFATIAAIAMIASCVAMPMTTAFAATDDTENANTITVKDEAGYTHDEVAAYQIFAGKFENSQLTVNGWGDGVNVKAFITALKADATFGDGDANLFAGVTYDSKNPAKSAQDVAKVVAGFSKDSVMAEVFAKIAVANKSTTTSGLVTPATEEESATISKLPDGYYVIVDESSATTSEGGDTAWSLGMLKVAGGAAADLEVTTKLDYPKMEKKIYENVKSADVSANHEEDTKWNDVADYSIGDTVPFKLYAQMPSNIADYQHYYIKFTDNLGEEFTLPSDATFEICVNGEPVAENVFNIHKDVNGNTIEITIEDVYALGATITAESVITVEYSAILNENAEIGLDGQTNTAKLEYSNNPNVLYAPKTDGPTDEEKEDGKENDDYTEEDTTPENPDVKDDTSTSEDDSQDNTGDTPWDTVIAFTYELDVTKVDGSTGEELEGAEFVLKNATGDSAKYAMVDADGKFRGWSDAKIDNLTSTTINGVSVAVTTKLVSGENGLFTVCGLDDGTYYLEETKEPGGYNKLASDVKLEISANTQHTQEWSGTAADALKQWAVEEDDTNPYDVVKLVVGDKTTTYSKDDTYAVGTEVENFMGLQLPSTGGIGTTIFYVVGGTMAAGAGVYLISKKRMKKDEE